MSHESKVSADHDEIRKWVEKRNGHPASVKNTEKKGEDSGLLRIDFPGYSGVDTLEKINWEEFVKIRRCKACFFISGGS